MTSCDFWRNNGNNDKQCGCFNMTRAEPDGKLLSHLEWPNLKIGGSYHISKTEYYYFFWGGGGIMNF